MPSQSIIMDEQLPSVPASGPSVAVATVTTPPQGNWPTGMEEMLAILQHLALTHGFPPIQPLPIGGRPIPEILPSRQGSANQPIAPPRIPSAGPNGVVITTPHPRLVNYPPRIYREGPIGSGSSGHRGLYLASPLAEPSGTYRIPRTNHVRTMGLQENKAPPGSSGQTPYFFTSRNPVERPLAETDNIGRYTNRQPRTGPQLRFQFERREPQQPPARPVRRPEPVVEILEEEDSPDAEGGVRSDSETSDDEGMEIFHLNDTALF